jgi:hypothetical protein
MALLITDNTVPEFWLSDGVFESEVFTAPGADTFAKGTLLARLTSSSKLVPYETAQSDGSEIPLALLAEELITTGSGDTTLRVFLSGKVRKDQLLVYTGGSPVVPTTLELDLLHNFGIIGLSDRELLRFDNS